MLAARLPNAAGRGATRLARAPAPVFPDSLDPKDGLREASLAPRGWAPGGRTARRPRPLRMALRDRRSQARTIPGRSPPPRERLPGAAPRRRRARRPESMDEPAGRAPCVGVRPSVEAPRTAPRPATLP